MSKPSLKYFPVLLPFLISLDIAYSQSIPTSKDSLLLFIESYTERDSIRVNALIDLQDFFLVDDHTKGRVYIEEAIEISRKNDFKAGLGSALNSLGGYFIRQGELDSALVKILEAIEIFEKIEAADRIIAAYNNLAIIYGQTGEVEKAVSTYLKIVDLLESKPPSNRNVVVYYNLALAYQLMDRNEEFEIWMRKVIETSEQLNFTFGIVQGNLQLASFEFIQENYHETIRISEYVLNIIEVTGAAIKQGEARAYSLKANALERLENFDDAVLLKSKSIAIYENINATQSLLFAQEELSDIYRKKGDYKNAFESILKAQSLKDSIFTADQQAIVEELQTKYETERFKREKESTELENLRLQNENRKTQFLLFGTLGFVLIMGIGGLAYSRNQQLKKKAELAEIELDAAEKRLEIEKEKRNAELKAVRSQLNPHFIFNLMSSVQEMTISGEQEKANKAIEGISSIMRKTLAYSEQETISLKDELDLVRLYLEAEQLRLEERLTFTFDIDEEVETEFIQVIPMLIQPFVENSVKHGISHKKEGGNISINISLTESDLLKIEITDNGIGRAESIKINQSNYRGNGYSTQANEQRLANIAKETGSNASVQIKDLKNNSGTTVIITYPLTGVLNNA